MFIKPALKKYLEAEFRTPIQFAKYLASALDSVLDDIEGTFAEHEERIDALVSEVAALQRYVGTKDAGS